MGRIDREKNQRILLELLIREWAKGNRWRGYAQLASASGLSLTSVKRHYAALKRLGITKELERTPKGEIPALTLSHLEELRESPEMGAGSTVPDEMVPIEPDSPAREAEQGKAAETAGDAGTHEPGTEGTPVEAPAQEGTDPAVPVKVEATSELDAQARAVDQSTGEIPSLTVEPQEGPGAPDLETMAAEVGALQTAALDASQEAQEGDPGPSDPDGCFAEGGADQVCATGVQEPELTSATTEGGETIQVTSQPPPEAQGALSPAAAAEKVVLEAMASPAPILPSGLPQSDWEASEKTKRAEGGAWWEEF